MDQTVILWDGWKVAGWVLARRDGQLELVAYRSTGTEFPGDLGTPPYAPVASMSKAAIRSAYEEFRTRALASGTVTTTYFIDSNHTLDHFILSPCFSAPLPQGA